MSKKLFASLTLSFAAASAFASAPASPILHVDWPKGWKVSKVPVSAPNVGAETTDMKRVRATKMEGGRIKATIELTSAPLRKQKDLESEFAEATQAARKQFEASGKEVLITSPSETGLGGHDALQVQMGASDKKTNTIVEFVMTYSKGYAYTLTYSAASRSDFAMFRKELQQVRETLKLQD